MTFELLDESELVELVNNSVNFKDLMSSLGYLRNSGSTYKLLRQYLLDNNIDFSHFYDNFGIHSNSKYSLSELLVLEPRCNIVNQRLIKRLLDADLIDYECSSCGNKGVWNDKPLVLQLEHKNGNNRDFRLHNLCLLCPNCHSQTDTYCGKNIGKYFKPYYVDEIIDLLRNSTTSINDIAFSYGLSRRVVSDINNGHTFRDDSISYPIRIRVSDINNEIVRDDSISNQIHTRVLKENTCKNCGKFIDFRSILCNRCEGLRRQEVNILPISREELKNMIRTQSFVSIGKSFNVSDNAVRKWCKKYNLPSSHSAIKSYTDEEWNLL